MLSHFLEKIIFQGASTPSRIIIFESLDTPIDLFLKQIGISKIEIIDDEAIAACIYQNEKLYIHSNISSNGITLLIKSLNNKD